VRRLLMVFVVMAAMVAAMAVPALAAPPAGGNASLEAQTVSNYPGQLGPVVKDQTQTTGGQDLGYRISSIAPSPASQ
jgi:hypothetical protein